jgi:hypothetical protein
MLISSALVTALGALMGMNIGTLVGTWVNTDPATGGVVRVVISEVDGNLRVHFFGACYPTPCDWQEVDAVAHAEFISGGNAVAFTAHYDPGFAKMNVAGHLEHGLLIVEIFDVFTDGSARASIFYKGSFKKA